MIKKSLITIVDFNMQLKKYSRIAITFIFMVMSINVYSQTNINSTMIQDVMNMPPSEQQRLAQQYGINIPTGMMNSGQTNTAETPVNTDDSTPSSSSVLSPELIKAQRLIADKDKEEEIDKIERDGIPIFERDYDIEQDFPIFGMNLFDNQVSTFASVDNAPVPDNYRLGPGDNIKLLLFGSQNDEFNLSIDRSGNINMPQLGNLSIAGMTFDQATEYIKSRISSQMIGVNVNISMGRLRTISVFLVGEALIPGSYSISAMSTISQLLFTAGGVSEIGSLRNIRLNSSDGSSFNFDLYDLLSKGDISGDRRLRSGDVVFIPTIKKVAFVDGAVKRPGRYELLDNETIEDLLSFSGGTENRAYTKKISIEKYDTGSDFPIIENLDLTDPSSSSYVLSDGDIIRIASVDDRANNSITIKGAAQRTGEYGFYKGIRFTDIINKIDGDLEKNTDLDVALIVRKESDTSRKIIVKSFSIKNAIEKPNSFEDPQLMENDEILIFSFSQEELEGGGKDLLKVESDVDQGLSDLNQRVQENDYSFNNSSIFGPTELINVIADQEYKKIIEFKKEINKQKELRKGNRIDLIEPVIQKLYQQATVDEPVQVVSIDGGVRAPGEYPLIEGFKYLDLVQLAGGFTEDAYVDRAELRRLETDEKGAISTELIEIDITNDLSNGIDSSVSLMSRDNLKIRRIKDWNIKDSITLTGEVMYPGEYLISPNETLSSVLNRAGGFTNEAFIEAALFTRESIKEKEREQLQILGDTIRRDQASRSMTKESEDFSVNSKEIEDGIAALLSTEVIGRLIIDLPRLMSGDDGADIALQDGDVLDIPKFTNAVTVVGEVRRSGSFVRQDSYKLDDYLELAAGMTARGNKKEIYIIRANGSVDKIRSERAESLLKFASENDGILAGDTIVVPIKSSYQTPLNMYRTVSQVVFQSIASIAAFGTVFD